MKRAATILAATAAMALALLAPASAHADQVKFSGMHPIPASLEVAGGFCYIDVPHVHVYTPEKVDVLYRVHDDHHHFVGDPVGFGYDGPKHSYYGHHPVSVNASVHVDLGTPATEYCYIDGPHYHGYEPPPEFRFTVKGDAYWYIGKFPPAYHKRKKHLVKINAVYEPIVYARPVVVFDAPPPGYHGPVVNVDVHVHAPPHIRAGVEVHVPVPTLDVHIGVPGVVVRDHRHHKHKRYKYKKHKKHKKHRRGWR